LLMADLVKLAVVITQTEILEVLRALGITIDKPTVGKCLYLLDNLGLVNATRYSKTEYYLSPSGVVDHIRYSMKDPARFADRSRLRSLIREEFFLTKQKEHVINAFDRKAGGGI
jgi:arginine repressor